MTLDELRNQLPDTARDLKLNLGSVLTPQGAPGLEERVLHAVALAVAHATGDTELAQVIESNAGERLDGAHRSAAKAAATIMAMNNVYYRFTHLVSDPEYARLPARLRMNVIGNPGIGRLDFELLCLAVSAVNGCGACMDAHERQVREGGLAREAVQSAVRIAAVVNAVAAARAMERTWPAAQAGLAA